MADGGRDSDSGDADARLVVGICLLAFATLFAGTAGASDGGDQPAFDLPQGVTPCTTSPLPAGVGPQLQPITTSGPCVRAAPSASGGAAGFDVGSVNGRISEEDTGLPIEGACAVALDDSGLFFVARTNELGRYTIEGRQGSYGFWLLDCRTPGSHRPEWHSNQPDYLSSWAVFMSFLPRSVDAELSPGGQAIMGRVTDATSGDPLEHVCAWAVDGADQFAGLGATDESGVYAINGLDPGDYIVFFEGCSSPATHVNGWYPDAGDIGTAEDVTVPEVGNVDGIDIELTLGATINGTITTSNRLYPEDLPVGDICVDAFNTVGFHYGFGVSNSDGSYTMGGLPEGGVKLFFSDCGFEREEHYVPQWHGGESFADATTVDVGEPGTKRSVDQAIQDGEVRGGWVGDEATGSGIHGICVQAYDEDFDFLTATRTERSGGYELSINSYYYVLFLDCRPNPEYVWQFWDGAANSEDARRASFRDDVHAAMQQGGLVNGTATDEETGEPLGSVCVSAFRSSNELVEGFGTTDRSGRYTIPLRPGGHKLFFFDCGIVRTHNPEWWNDARDIGSASSVQVGEAGTKVEGRSPALARHHAGDADCSAAVTTIDAALMLQFVAFLLDDLDCIWNADVDDDGLISPIDASLVLQFVAGLLSEL